MSDDAPAGFDPKAFFELARKIGHGRALGLKFREAGPNWAELALPWREELVGVPETGVLASGAIVSLIDTASGTSVWVTQDKFAPIVTDWAARLRLGMHVATVVHPHDYGSIEHPEAVMEPIVEHFGGSDRIGAMLLTSRYRAGALADYAADLPAAVVAVNGHCRTGVARFALGSRLRCDRQAHHQDTEHDGRGQYDWSLGGAAPVDGVPHRAGRAT